jgi:hypothetical protein
MNNAVLWNVMPCGPCKNGRFGGTYRLHYKSVKKNRRAVTSIFFSACFGCWLLLTFFLDHWFLSSWRYGWNIPPKPQFLQEPPSVTSQKIEIFTNKVHHRKCAVLKQYITDSISITIKDSFLINYSMQIKFINAQWITFMIKKKLEYFMLERS